MKSFLSIKSDGKQMTDKVFKAAVAANKDISQYGDVVVNATLGTLFNEESKFVAFDSVWSRFSDIDNIQKAKYAASIQGNPDFQEAVKTWLFKDVDVDLDPKVIATPGGAGAISSTMKNVCNPGDAVIIPSQGWGPYKTMANEFYLELEKYNMFDGNHFDLSSFESTISNVLDKQDRALVIINDPCHNPTGYTMSRQEWDDVITIVNRLSVKGPIVILNDIAYIDFNNQGNEYKKNFKRFANLNENVLAIIAFSTSKTLTAYGARCGAQVVIGKNKQEVNKFVDASIYSARSIWSTVNNSAMKLFTLICTNENYYKDYLKEKNSYVDLLKERASIFVNEAKEVGLPIYPYKEGFFVTLKLPDSEKELCNKKLQENHVFTVEVDGGLRVAICSVPKKKLIGLARKIKELI